jgi:hypothetical protein
VAHPSSSHLLDLLQLVYEFAPPNKGLQLTINSSQIHPIPHRSCEHFVAQSFPAQIGREFVIEIQRLEFGSAVRVCVRPPLSVRGCWGFLCATSFPNR